MTPPPLMETAAKNTVVPQIERMPITHNVAAIIRLVGHHEYERVTVGMVETNDDGSTESRGAGVLNNSQGLNTVAALLQDLPSVIDASIVYHYDLMRNIIQAQLNVQMFDGRGNALLLIPCWYYYAEQLKG
jgi:hypothetical protein